MKIDKIISFSNSKTNQLKLPVKNLRSSSFINPFMTEAVII